MVFNHKSRLCYRCPWSPRTRSSRCPSSSGTSRSTCLRRGPRCPVQTSAAPPVRRAWRRVLRPRRRSCVQASWPVRRFPPRVTRSRIPRVSRSPRSPVPSARRRVEPRLPATGGPTRPPPCSVCPPGPPYPSSPRETWLLSPLPALSSSLQSTAAATTLMVSETSAHGQTRACRSTQDCTLV